MRFDHICMPMYIPLHQCIYPCLCIHARQRYTHSGQSVIFMTDLGGIRTHDTPRSRWVTWHTCRYPNSQELNLAVTGSEVVGLLPLAAVQREDYRVSLSLSLSLIILLRPFFLSLSLYNFSSSLTPTLTLPLFIPYSLIHVQSLLPLPPSLPRWVLVLSMQLLQHPHQPASRH